MSKYKLSNSGTIKQSGGTLFNHTSYMENPLWPPQVDKIILVKNPDIKEIFLGKVHVHIWNNTASVLILLNHQDYVEQTLKTPEVAKIFGAERANGKGLFLVIPTYIWRYADDELMAKINTLTGYDYNLIGKISPLPRNEGVPITQDDLQTEAIYKDYDRERSKEPPRDKLEDTLLTTKHQLNYNTLFQDNEVNGVLEDPHETFTPPTEVVRKVLTDKLKLFEELKSDDGKNVVNKSVSIKNLITTRDDEINEGNKIITWIQNNLMNNESPFYDLKTKIHNGWVHISRKGINVNDKITDYLVPNLNYFKWQVGKPIDYDALKYVLFQNNFQKSITNNVAQQKEAEKILSQEYLVAFTPKPQYLMWCLKRLIMCWYADVDLQNNIRKIKVLINQYRAQGNTEFNNKYGIQGSIIICSRYGVQAARTVLTRLSYYFSLYKNLGWPESTPSYFIKVNDLVWYTNGSIDLKLYFRNVVKSSNGSLMNKTFEDKYSGIVGSNKLLVNP